VAIKGAVARRVAEVVDAVIVGVLYLTPAAFAQDDVEGAKVHPLTSPNTSRTGPSGSPHNRPSTMKTNIDSADILSSGSIYMLIS
jgi:hypothetical protein